MGRPDTEQLAKSMLLSLGYTGQLRCRHPVKLIVV